jgi:hypothetical protein
VKARPSSLVRIVLQGWFALTIGTLLLMRRFHIGLGEGSFAYLFSERQGDRIVRALWLLPIAAVTLLAIARAASRDWLAPWLALLAVIGFTIWTFLAPIKPIEQHSFNLHSPSHDGAFVNEVFEMRSSLGDYLRGFDRRIQQSPSELRGTRVISNPPGMTILFYAVPYCWTPDIEHPGWLERFLSRHYDLEGAALINTMVTVQIAAFLMILWLLAAIVLYAAARVIDLPPSGAMLCVLIAWFNPSTVHFAPGKDPAQLLTVGLMSWTWLIAWKQHRPLIAAIAGAVMLLSATIGLIHFWIAAALIVATFWQERQRTLRLMLYFVAGAVAIDVLVYLLIDWNIFKTLFTVWRRFTQIQHELALNHTIWFFIGLPLFLLFVSPAMVLPGALELRDRRMNFGARLAIVTVGMMALSYILGVTYELPRLWVVFLPLLSLGLLSVTPLAGVRHNGRALRAVMFIAIVHILFTAAHWSMLDARESEHRLSGPAPTYFGKT